MSKSKYNFFLVQKPILALGIFLLMSFNVHKYYFSLTEINIDTSKKTFNVSCKMFTEDLEDALEKIHSKKLDINRSFGDTLIDNYIDQYVHKRFKVFLDGKSIAYKFIGYEIEEEAIWCYLEMNKFKNAKRIMILNSLLYDYLPDQVNIIQLNVDKKKQTEKLINTNAKVEFDLR